MGAENTRRSKQQLEKDIMDALERLVTERGFMNLPMLALVKEAKIDFNVFYRHCGSADNLYKKFTNQYNFWLSDTLNISSLRLLGDKKFFAESLKKIYTELEQNPVMQKLLLWELEEDNEITRETADMREKLNLNLMAYYGEKFAPSGIDINAVSALLIAGIFYLTLHRGRSSFCSVDDSRDEGKKRIIHAMDTFTELLFDKLTEKERQREMIQRMMKDGIPKSKIADYLDISQYRLNDILRK